MKKNKVPSGLKVSKPGANATKASSNGVDQAKIKRLEKQVEGLIQGTPESSGTSPKRFTPEELLRVAKAQAKADKKAFNIEAQIAELNAQINKENLKAVTAGRKNHGNG